MKHTLGSPITVGDFSNRVVVDELDIQSISLTLDPQNPVLSVVLVHKASGWQHVVTYTDSSAVEFWARAMEREFDAIADAMLKRLVADGKLPAGRATALAQRSDP